VSNLPIEASSGSYKLSTRGLTTATFILGLTSCAGSYGSSILLSVSLVDVVKHVTHTNACDNQASDAMNCHVNGAIGVRIRSNRIIRLPRWITTIIVGDFFFTEQSLLFFG